LLLGNQGRCEVGRSRLSNSRGNLLLQASILSGRTNWLRRQRHGITSSAYLPVASSRALLKKQPQLGADREVICSRSRFMTQCPTVICTEPALPRRGNALRVGMRTAPPPEQPRARLGGRPWSLGSNRGRTSSVVCLVERFQSLNHIGVLDLAGFCDAQAKLPMDKFHGIDRLVARVTLPALSHAFAPIR
jgi:hypothetical protein